MAKIVTLENLVKMSNTFDFRKRAAQEARERVDPTDPEKVKRPLTPIDLTFMNMTTDLLNLRTKKNWTYSVRASGLPLCQWEAMLADAVGSDGPQETTSFAQEFYREVGTTAHRVIQRWMARLGVLFGPYKCNRCRLVTISLGEPKACPQGCKNIEWSYQEINLVDAEPSGIIRSAHADGLIHLPDMEPNHYYVVDFKTCSLRTLPRPEYGLEKSYHKDYLHQTAIYVNLISRSDDMICDGTVFMFIPRDDPSQISCIVIDQSETNGQIYHEAIKKVRAAREAARTGDAEHIERLCKTKPPDEDCPFNDLCFDRQRTIDLFRKRGVLPILPDF